VKHAEDCRAAADHFFTKGVKKVVITLGDKGVYAHDGVRDAFFPVVPVQAVDTTGAGDAFSGGFVVALAEGRDFFDAVAFGSIAAGLSVTRVGTAIAMPFRAEIDQAHQRWADLFTETVPATSSGQGA
jgi:ribokinase